MPSETHKREIFKSAIDGRIVTKQFARENPLTTFCETVLIPRKLNLGKHFSETGFEDMPGGILETSEGQQR